MKLCIFLAILFSLNVYAKSNEAKMYGVIGADFGYNTISESKRGSNDKDGFHFGIKGLTSFYSNNFILDAGLGWMYSEVSNSLVTVETRSAFFDGALRFRFNSLWSFGPAIMVPFANDNSFSELDNNNSAETFLGAGLHFEPNLLENRKVRFNVRFQKSLTIEDRDVYITTFGVQFGLPLWGAPSKVKYVNRTKIIEKTKFVPKIVKISKDRLRATISGDIGLNFATNSDEPRPKLRKYLERLGHFVTKYQDQYTRIIISGHTDDVGKASYNLDLSRRRAMRVKEILVKEGAPSRKIQVKWYGESRPKVKGTSSRARAENRRVEFDFIGMKKIDAFYHGLGVIK